jgi:uncharacterized FAD-dependent dehydrogenase
VAEEPLIIDGLRLEVGESEDALTAQAARHLGVDASAIAGLEIVRRALDARRKRDIHWVINVAVTLPDTRLRERVVAAGLAHPPRTRAKDSADREIIDGVAHGSSPSSSPPVVVGSGPGGLFAAWLLAREGYHPVVIERGPAVPSRVRSWREFNRSGTHDPESNILYGEGGAGTFSDGKLTTRSRSPLVRLVQEVLVGARAPEEILIAAKPHVGTDRLRAVVIALRRTLERMGACFRFGARVGSLDLDARGAARGVILADGSVIPAETVLLATGHSARETYATLDAQGVALELKAFQLGLRIEHPQGLIDRAQHGGFADRLPAAEYVLNDRRSGVFSFCMCPGGTIVACVSEAGHLCSNGMSRSRRDSGRANSGLVFTISPDAIPGADRSPLAGVELQRHFERHAFTLGGSEYAMPAQRAEDFLRGRLSRGPLASSYARGHVAADLREVLPEATSAAMVPALGFFDRLIPAFVGEGLLVGPESRGSSPVRIPRDGASRESVSTPGLYPVGEGAGYAGGIVSAAIDGLRSAAAIIRRHAPP